MSDPIRSAVRRSTKSFIHGLLDRCRTQLRARRIECWFVQIDQVLGHKLSIYDRVMRISALIGRTQRAHTKSSAGRLRTSSDGLRNPSR